ncbi:MAG TPA: TonB-dependent receptor [Paludibacteraceae bacterium]|nr:TonB-dependent receptor [Paludibacteraceae bacterium]
MRKLLLLTTLIMITLSSFAQEGTIKGRLFNMKTNEPIEFATIQIEGTTIGSTSDLDGNFIFTGIKPGFVKLIARSVGFETTVSSEIQVQGNQTTFVDIAVPEAAIVIKEVVVRQNLNIKRIESPISVLSVGVQEIEKSAGANRDVSKVLQSLPGVGATDPNRNDLIVRGGGPSENVFYLDGIEIPVINHFATQGSSGGAVGVINPDFVREINFYTGAFPANRTNALSSVMEIKQKDGSKDRVHTKLSVGASDAALTLDGPIGKKSTFIVSARQSYLQLLFKLIGLPFLPTYNDFQVKYKYQIDQKNELTFVGIGAIDNMTLNTELEKTGTEAQKYLLSYLPIYKQWNYTVGLVYKHFGEKHIDNWVLSRNMLRNNNFKFKGNDDTLPKVNENLLSDYTSDEAENKLRFERDYPYLPVKLKIGAGLRYSHYTNETFRRLFYNNTENELNYQTNLNLFGYQAFAQASDEYLDNRLKLSVGVSLVGNNYNKNMQNPLNQFSPRLSVSYTLSDKWDLNANFGRYAMQPAYTTLGFRYATGGPLVNQNENLKYVTSNQAIVGIEYRPAEKMRLTVEGFYKQYQNYPLSVSDGLSIASKGTDYGQIGDEEIISTGKGRAYGVEVLYKIMEWKNLNITSTYTFFRSEFTDKNDIYRPSSWDTRHLLNLISSYKFGKSWNIAMRWRYVGGAPYSPIDFQKSGNRVAWNITNQPYIDYANFNSLRLKDAHQLDLRLDKEFYFKKWVLNLYTDIQNVYNFQSQSIPIYTNKTPEGTIIPDPNGDITRQGLRVLETYNGTVLPTIGLIIKI